MAIYEDWHRDRLEVRPGITGLWQVGGRSELDFDEYVRLDLFYIENWSVAIVPLTAYADERGFVVELFRRQWIQGMREVVQANLSRSGPNVLRGLHFHRRQADYWCVLEGEAFIGLYDLRSGSPSEGRGEQVRITAEERRCLYIPRGVAHGFYTPTGLLLQYLVDEYYTGSDEFGVAWNDPDVGIPWPVQSPILSDRDGSNLSLAEVRSDLPPFP